MPDPIDPLLAAISFAARAHKGQFRKDGETPYVAHVFRVAFVLRHLFKIDDPTTLVAAVLHDTIEDTTTDYDEIAERFGDEVAGMVVALTKDSRLPEEEREAAYGKQLLAAGPAVCQCKLADIYDNLTDSPTMPPAKRAKSLANARRYLDVFRPTLHARCRGAFALVEARLTDLAAGMTA